MQEDDVVEVTGTVRELELLDVEEELGRDLEDDVLQPYEGEPAILAVAVDQ